MATRRESVEFSTARRQGYFGIGQAAEITGISAKMIRHYEALGLIPKASRTVGSYRVYSAADLHSLRFVRRARDLGFSIKEIQTLLGLWRNRRRASAEVKRLAQVHIDALDRKIGELQAMRASLAELAHHCHGDHRPHCPILDDLGGLSTGAA
jgi:Cu(I)-responsive transcriptional regulator